jgi:hypothetical protein
MDDVFASGFASVRLTHDVHDNEGIDRAARGRFPGQRLIF